MTARSPHSERYESCFIHGGGVQDLLLATRIKGKIDATADAAAAGETGNYIRIALYNWYSSGGGQEIAASLARAQKSGVSVRVVVGPADDGLMSYLTSKGVDVTPCAKSCMNSGSGAMHNKCFPIKKGDTKLVIQSSGNLKGTQATHAQNLLISRDDAALFSAYANYWRRRLNAQGRRRRCRPLAPRRTPAPDPPRPLPRQPPSMDGAAALTWRDHVCE